MISMKNKLLHSLLPAIIWSVLICFLLIIPGQDFPEGPRIPSLDKIVHAFLFGMQVFLWCRYGSRATGRNIRWIFFLIFLLSCIYGIGMEYVQQYWVANRSFELGDIVADIAGSLGGWIIYHYLFFQRGR
jgi:VanZ family protein